MGPDRFANSSRLQKQLRDLRDLLYRPEVDEAGYATLPITPQTPAPRYETLPFTSQTPAADWEQLTRLL